MEKHQSLERDSKTRESELASALESYFSLVKRLVNDCPRLDAIKRSVCIEGARMAFARVMVQWAKMNVVKLATEAPPAGKEHRTPERYFEDVLVGSRLVAEKRAKDVIFE